MSLTMPLIEELLGPQSPYPALHWKSSRKGAVFWGLGEERVHQNVSRPATPSMESTWRERPSTPNLSQLIAHTRSRWHVFSSPHGSQQLWGKPQACAELAQCFLPQMLFKWSGNGQISQQTSVCITGAISNEKVVSVHISWCALQQLWGRQAGIPDSGSLW